MMRSGLTIFVIFFGIAVLDAVSKGEWTTVAFWILVGIAFALIERRGRGGTPRINNRIQ